MSLELIGITVVALWVLSLTIYVIFTIGSLNKLTKDVDKGNLIQIIDKVLSSDKNTKSEMKVIKRTLADMSIKMKSHIQKVGFVRYNPFSELGGDHSFSLVLLDEGETGFLVTGLHTRERTRVYVKEIINGTSSNELSSDEKKALEIAKKE